MHGKVAAVTTRLLGAEVVEDSTGTTVLVDDAAPFDETGGSLTRDGEAIAYVSADPQAETITLAEALTVAAGELLDVDPPLPVVTATVVLGDGGDAVDARVPHAMKARLPEGVRDDPTTAETVTLEWSGSQLLVADVLGRDASQTWGDPTGRGTDVGEGGIVVRDTMVVDSLESLGDVRIAGVSLVGRVLDGASDEGWLDRFSAAVVARQIFNNPTTQRSTGEEWTYAVLGATCRAGRVYRVSASVQAVPGVAGGVVACRLRVAAGGYAGQSSPQKARVDLGPAYSAGNAPFGYMQGFIGYSSDTDVELVVTYHGLSGATPTMNFAELVIEDVGPQGTYGGGSYRHIGPADPPPSTPAGREYTSTWIATQCGTYRQSGSRRTDVRDLVQGYVAAGAVNGHNQALVIFGASAAISGETSKTPAQALAGATLRKAEVWLHADHWHNSAGGTARLGKWGSSAGLMPSSLNASPSLSVAGWKRDSSKWVTVPTSWFSDSNTGVTLGGGSSRFSEYYGRFTGIASGTKYAHRPRLRLTYTR